MPDEDRQLDDWVRRIAPRAVAYARTLLEETDRAEDVVQDVFLRLLGHPEYDLLRDGERLLFRSVTNACINARTRRRELASLDAASGEERTLGDDVAAPAHMNPACVAEQRELAQAVRTELRRLPPMQRAAVDLRALGHSLQEVAEALDVSAQNAGVLVHRGRLRLREALDARLSAGWAGGEG